MEDKKKLRNVLIFTFLVSVLIGQWIGGMIFFKFNVISGFAHPFTLMSYWYGGQAWEQNFVYRVGFVVACIFPFVMTIGAAVLLTQKPKRELHGSARFARTPEVVSQNLFKTGQKDPEILIGKFNGKLLRWSGKQFAFLAAPTRSSKGVGIVIPNCLNYRDSMVVFDPKLENFRITSGYRYRVLSQDVYLFNPSAKNLRSHCWNPLSYVSRVPYRTMGDAMNIAAILYAAPEGGDNGNAKFFAEMAQKLFVGLILYMVETEQLQKKRKQFDPQKHTPTLMWLNKLTTPTPTSQYKNFAGWIKNVVDPDPNYSVQCKNNLMSYATTSDQTAASILSSMIAPLSVFIDPIVGKITSKDDFDLRDVRKKRMTIYIGIQPNDIAKFSRLINLFVSQLISQNASELPEDNPELKYQCLLLLDEFAAMGKVSIIEESVAWIAGYNIRLFPIFQNMSQLNRLYTVDGARSMSTNFECHIIYPPRDQQDAKEYSEILGTETFKSRSTSRNKGSIGNSSVSISDQSRAIMNPTELKTMPTSDCIISMTGMNPIRAQKIIYYKDPYFTSRLNYEPPIIPEIDLSKEDFAQMNVPKEGSAEPHDFDEEALINELASEHSALVSEMVIPHFQIDHLSKDKQERVNTALAKHIPNASDVARRLGVAFPMLKNKA